MEFYFHVNPPEQRGKQRTKKKRVTFCGIIPIDPDTEQPGNTLQIGKAYCHTVDQFCRKTGRIKARGNTLSQQHWSVDVTNITPRDRNDYFVQTCRNYCDNNNIIHDYQRRVKKNKQQSEPELVAEL